MGTHCQSWPPRGTFCPALRHSIRADPDEAEPPWSDASQTKVALCIQGSADVQPERFVAKLPLVSRFVGEQVPPQTALPANSGAQVHVKLPVVFLQVALATHAACPSTPAVHSSMSVQLSPSPV